MSDKGKFTLRSTTPLPAGAPAATRVGDRIFTSGIVSDRTGGIESESHRVFQLIAEMAHANGFSLSDVVRTRIWHTSPDGNDAETLLKSVHGVVFPHPGPTLSIIQIDCLPGDAAVSVELEVMVGSGATSTRFGADIESSSSAAVLVDEELWLAGQRGDPVGSRDSQVVQAVEQASAMLRELGMGAGDIVSTRHFMRHDTQFEADPPEWLDFKKDSIPTSAGIAVNGAGDPDHHFVFELEAVKNAGGNRTNLRTGRTFEVEHNYCRAVRVDEGEVVYVAGTTSIIPGETVQHPYEVGPQVADTLEIVRWAIEKLGLKWDDLVHTRTYVVGGSEKLAEAIESLEEVLDTESVACSVIGVPVLGRPEVVVEIEARAVKARR